jgi:hypothetical protein
MRRAGMVFWSSADSIFVSRFCLQISLVSRFPLSEDLFFVSRFCQQIFLVSRFTFCQQILSAYFHSQQFRFLSEECLMFRLMEHCNKLLDDVFE